MKISKFSIKNYSRIVDVDIDVRDHLILVGPNDVGKSSLLRALNFALGLSGAQLYGQLSQEDLRDTTQPFLVDITLAGLTTADGGMFPDELITDSTTNEITLIVSLEVTAEAGSDTVQIRRTCAKGRHGRQMTRDQLVAIGWKFLTATQSTLRDIRDDRDASLQDILSAIELGGEQAAFDKINEALQDQLSGSKVLEDLRQELSVQLSKALPQDVKKDELEFVSAAAATKDPFADVHLQVTRSGVTKGLAEQSDGARALFAMALYDLVSASAHIVAIDEPEVHLHPASQRSLARLLFGGDNQKVLATHSSDIVGVAEPEWIVSVREGGVLKQPTAGFLSAEERLLASWWVKDKLEPLTARHLVAVEGASDRIFLQKAAELLGADFDRLGVSLLEMGGSGIDYILKLFGASGFDVPLSILIDEDAKTRTAKAFGSAESDLESVGVFTCVKDLEGEYVRAVGATELYKWLDASNLFSKNEFANCKPSGPGGSYTDQDLMDFCGTNKYKTRAAIAIVANIRLADVEKIKPIVDLLTRVSIP